VSLRDFTTLALAHDHPETKGRMTSPDMVVSLLTENDSVITLQDKAKTDAKAAGFLLALNGAVTEYNLITGHAIGDKQQLLLTYLVYIGAVTPEFKNAIILYANPVTYPHATATQEDFDEAHDSGEIIVLPSVLGQHSIRVNTTVQPRVPTTLIIEHRFGTDATNLTGWHELGSVINIYYPTALKGAPYESGQMPATKAAYREIRLVSPLTLGVTLYVASAVESM
jgi:hypothetical protein